MAHRIFNIPELLRLIFEHLESWYLRRLTTVSRQFFLCSIPFNWEHLSRSGKLRNVIFPGVKTNDMDQDWLEGIKPLNQQYLARFNLYAPHIRYLSDYITSEGGGSISWFVILKVIPTRPLLPNLRHCLIYDEDQQLDASPVLRSLLCPSLIEIRAEGGTGGSARPVLSPQLITRIVESAPKLQTLELYSRPARGSSHTAANTPTLVPPKRGLLGSVVQLQALQTLEAGPEILLPDIMALLGTLPCLRSLSICIPSGTPESMIPTQFPQISNDFQALEHLGIYHWRPESLVSLWRRLPLVQRLVSAYIKIEPDFDEGDDILHDLLSSVALCSPNLTELHVLLLSEDALHAVNLFTPSIIAGLGCLPLQCIRIVSPDPSLILFPPNNFAQLALALTRVEYFELPTLIVTFEGIVAMAQYMPQLQFLEAELSPTAWPRKTALPLGLPASEAVILIRSSFTDARRYVMGKDTKTYLESLPFVLPRLWPNGVHCDFSELAVDGVGEKELGELNLINQTIKQLVSPKEFTPPDHWVLESKWKRFKDYCTTSPVYKSYPD